MAIEQSEEGRPSPASQRLRARQQAWQEGTPEFERFARERHEHGMTLEREWEAAELDRDEGKAERSEGGGVSDQPVWPAAET